MSGANDDKAPEQPLGSGQDKRSWSKSVGDSFKTQAGTWFVGFVISVLAIFSSNITEHIKFALNTADLRSKYYEDFAESLSAYDFQAELIVEYLGDGLSDVDTMRSVINDYNTLITNLRDKEYVYLSWINRYWGKSSTGDVEAVYSAVKSFDSAVHSLNDEFRAVNVTKTKQSVDPVRVQQAMVRLRPALANLQEQSKKVLMELQ